MADAFDKLRMMEDEMNKYLFRNMFNFLMLFVIILFYFLRFEEEIGIPNYVDGTNCTQTYNQMNHHLMNPSNGYSTENDSTNSYMESTLPLNSGKY